jgi:hypothetical protein
LLALDALARQQEANARLTDENARLREDGRFLPPPNPDPIVEALSSALADRDATIARVEKALALAESVVNLGSAFRTALAEAAVVERDSTIARLRENAREMRDALSDYATPGEGWRETWHADVFERSRRLAPDATALTPAKEADRG